MKVWIVSVLLSAALTLRITEAAALISPKDAPEILPENFPDISPGNIVEISPEILPENYAEAAEISQEEPAEVYAEEAEVAELVQNPNEPSEKAAEMDVNEMFAEDRSVLCPPGWFRHGDRCFLLVRSAYTWLAAENHCTNNQATLASVQSPSEYYFLQNLLSVSGQSAAWIGAYNFLNTWMWKDNAKFFYTNWQSLNNVSNYPCAYMRSSGGWSNTNCGTGYVFFCAMNPSTC